MSSQTSIFRLGVDIGGTFTDLVLSDRDGIVRAVGKTLTTMQDPAQAVVQAISQMLRAEAIPAAEINGIIHGTTLVTNAIIERKGARTALVTTRGFRDALDIAREHRYDVYDLFIERPEPLAPRHLRFEIGERVLADGSVLQEIAPGEIQELVGILRSHGTESVAVCLLHSYRNPGHEREIAAQAAVSAPNLHVSLSSDVYAEAGEYERASTTVANAYVRPLVDGYLENLNRGLGEAGFAGSLHVMLSSGGTASLDTARRFPIRMVESGPAAGALAAAAYGRASGNNRLLSFDMGGTTAKACLIDEGQPSTSSSFEVARMYRFKRGSGLPIRVPVIEMIEIGAGGGSIARMTALGLLQVGPDSAGASPGPACYGLGGTEPTVTDADLLLGYLDPQFFLGGEIRLSREAAENAVGEIASALSLELVDAAWGIHNLVNENMAAAARMHAVEQGKDSQSYSLFAFGGAGPVHAFQLARALHIREIIYPAGAGIASSLGLLAAPLAFDFVRSAYSPLASLDWHGVNGVLSELESEGRTLLRRSGLADHEITIERSCEMRYLGQGSEITVPLPMGQLGPADTTALDATFDRIYKETYGRTVPSAQKQVLKWRVAARGPLPRLPAAKQAARTRQAGGALKGERAVYFSGRGYVPTTVYDRYRLAPGASLEGPAIIEERESTIVVGPGGTARVAADLSVVVTVADVTK